MEEYAEMLESKEREIESWKDENQMLKDRLENHPGIMSLVTLIFRNFK